MQTDLGSDELLLQRLLKENQNLRQENAGLRRSNDRKDAALLQLETQFAIGRHNIEAAEAVFASLDPPPLTGVG